MSMEELSKVEMEALIRAARQVRDNVMEKKLLLQEKELGVGDGPTAEAILHCENEIFVLTCGVAKLWRKLYPVASSGIPPPPRG